MVIIVLLTWRCYNGFVHYERSTVLQGCRASNKLVSLCQWETVCRIIRYCSVPYSI